MNATENKKRSTKRRGNGEGSIFQRGDGRWVATINVGHDERGKRIRKTVYGLTKSEVQEKLTALHGQKRSGKLCKVHRETLGEYLARWLADSVKIQRRTNTYISYESEVRNHIIPRLGAKVMAKLTPLDIQRAYADMIREGKSARLVQACHMVLHRALKMAVHPFGLIPSNPCTGLRPSAPKTEIRPLTPEQAVKFLGSTTGDRLHPLYVLAVTSGMRQGELFGLKWSDIDFAAGTVTVRRTLVRVPGEFLESEPKTAKGRRTIPIPAVAIEALEDHRRRMMVEGLAGREYVFLSRYGRNLRANGVRGRLRTALKRAGLPLVSFHALRHTSATMLMVDGVPAKVVSERLGHADVAITLNCYSHVQPSQQQDASDKFQARFGVAAG